MVAATNVSIAGVVVATIAVITTAAGDFTPAVAFVTDATFVISLLMLLLFVLV